MREKNGEHLKEKDYKKIVDYLELKNNVIMKNLIIIATKVGLRISDLLDLKFEDIKDEKINLLEGKTNKKRTIKLNSTVLECLNELRSYYKNLGYAENGYIFKSSNRASVKRLEDKAPTPRGINLQLKKLEEYFNLNYALSSHSLRKKFGRDIFNKSNGNIALVMKLLNHSSQAITLRYIGIEQAEIEEAYDLLD